MRVALLFVIGLLACSDEPARSPGQTAGTDAAPQPAEAEPSVVPSSFVGSARCAECHPDAFEAWRGSHHDLAMAGPEATVGDFDGAVLEHMGARWTFVREGDTRFIVHEDATGAVDRRPVVASFGIAPLQQVLVEGEGGRLHAWPVAWDARPADEGGQRWFELVEGEVASTPDDPLHRDGAAFEWNSQCAACHATALRKGYDERTHRFATTSAEVDVACEACHGPGGRHASLAASGEASANGLDVRFEPWRADAWQRDPAQRIASRVAPRTHDVQLDVCAPCHSRRSTLLEPAPIGASFLDGHEPRLLEPGLYFDDGRIDDEVYVWGSFQQSRMAAVGVRCSDCHDPHTLALRRPGNALCATCHAPEVFDTAGHRGHAEADAEAADLEPGTGRACVDCHMPTRTYMGVDARRDHSFPMPRPGRSAALGSPDPCLACHGERNAAWADAAIGRWRGGAPAKPHWADRLVADGAARPAGEAWLEVARAPGVPDFVRGSAWRRVALSSEVLPAPVELANRFEQGEALERLGLVELARRFGPADRVRLLAPRLEDARRAIRIAAAEALSESGADPLRPSERARLGRVLREYRAAQAANAERPEAQTNLAILAMRYGDAATARAILDRAIDRAPYFVPARVNRADLARAEGDEATARAELEAALRLTPDDARVRRAYGFALHRAGDPEGALAQLERAWRDAPGDPEVVLAYALALDGVGRRDEALRTLAGALDAGVESSALHHATVALALEAGRTDDARARFVAWRARFPADPQLEDFSGLAGDGASRQASPD